MSGEERHTSPFTRTALHPDQACRAQRCCPGCRASREVLWALTLGREVQGVCAPAGRASPTQGRQRPADSLSGSPGVGMAVLPGSRLCRQLRCMGGFQMGEHHSLLRASQKCVLALLLMFLWPFSQECNSTVVGRGCPAEPQPCPTGILQGCSGTRSGVCCVAFLQPGGKWSRGTSCCPEDQGPRGRPAPHLPLPPPPVR